MTDAQHRSSTRKLLSSKNRACYIATDLGLIAAMCVGAWLSVPIMYTERFNAIIWGLSILAFVGLPLLAGILRGKTSLPANVLAGMLLLACPVVYILTDPLPARFELLRDTFFLATGSTLTYVTTGWTASFGQHRQSTAMLVTVTIDVVAASSMPL